MDLQSRLLHRLDMKGIAEVDELASELEAEETNVSEALDVLRGEGYAEYEGFWYITDEGEAALNQTLRDRFTSEQIAQLEERFDEFGVFDAKVKELASEWQSAGDHPSKSELLDRLRDLQRQVESYFREFDEPIVDEYRRYLDNLDVAIQELEAGNEEYFTGADVNSYHTVWFQLHDDLLRTLGIEREE